MINEIKVKVSDKEYGFKFNNLSLKIFLDMSGIDISDLDKFIEAKPIDGILNMLIAANKVFNRGDEVSQYEMADVFELMEQDNFNSVWTMFIGSITNFSHRVGEAGEAAKKK